MSTNRKLALPKDYKHVPINQFFSGKKRKAEDTISEHSDVSSEKTPSQIDQGDETPTSSLELVNEIEQRPLKRLRRGSDKADETLPVYDETEDENDLDDEQRNQLNNNAWLMAVINHLSPLSEPLHNFANEKQRFLELKKQWGYVGEYELVDSAKTDCALCSHQHVAILFTIENILNQYQTQCASHCIKQFRAYDTNRLFHNKTTSREIIQSDIDAAYQEKDQERREIKKFFL